MSKTFITSDTHFSHAADFIVKARKFNSVDEMDSYLIKVWNETVGPNDTIYHLGDVCFKPATSVDKIMPQLNGKKILILGNHDKGKHYYKYFEDMYSIKEHDDYVFTHIPIHPYELLGRFLGKICVHGHQHKGGSDIIGNILSPNYPHQRRYLNVNCEFTTDFRPIEISQLPFHWRQFNTVKATLTIVRGIPGSGKSTYAKATPYVHVEADQFFVDKEGEYRFDGTKLQMAHEWCLGKVKKELLDDFNVIVSNTFTTLLEMEPYFNFCKKFGFPVRVIKMTGNYGSIHGVPPETIEKMKARWEDYSGEIIGDK